MELKKHIIDEKTGISYTLCGDYYLPDLALPAFCGGQRQLMRP